MGRVRLFARVAASAAALLVALPLHGAWRLVGARSPWPRRFLGVVARIVGARVRVTGRPVVRDIVLVSNHVSWTDILVLAGATGTAFVAKDELARVPLIGWLCSLNATVFVARDDRLAVGGQVGRIRDALATSRPLTLFAEGTTGTTLRPFKSALFAALDPAPPSVRVQPVRVDYGPATGEVAWIDDERGITHVRRLLSRRGTFSATLTFLDPFDPADHPGRKGIAAEARARIAMLGESRRNG